MRKYTYFVSYITPQKFGFGSCEVTLNSPMTSEDITYIQEKEEKEKGTGVVILGFFLLDDKE